MKDVLYSHALDSEGKRRSIAETESPRPFTCGDCAGEMIAKRGRKNRWHYAWKPGGNGPVETPRLHLEQRSDAGLCRYALGVLFVVRAKAAFRTGVEEPQHPLLAQPGQPFPQGIDLSQQGRPPCPLSNLQQDAGQPEQSYPENPQEAQPGGDQPRPVCVARLTDVRPHVLAVPEDGRNSTGSSAWTRRRRTTRTPSTLSAPTVSAS